MKILQGDCLEVLKTLEDNSVDSIVTDPPYELGFMGKKWDSTGIAYNVDLWKECLRVLKPGGHMLAFGGTRTYHRMTCAIEDAGFEIRDCIQWLYGSGFPKSHDISKAIDKRAGAEREVVGTYQHPDGKPRNIDNHKANKDARIADQEWGMKQSGFQPITAPATSEAKQWDGWGTCLKPANEPIVLARKPLSEKTIAENVMKWGTGGINIDGCRIPSGENELKSTVRGAGVHKTGNERLTGWNRDEYDGTYTPNEAGRFPANVILDEEAGRMLDEQQEGASRFFYCAKASKKERGEGNNHPTVKPVKLMEYLVKLITPPDGIVLDPFLGSGTTLLVAEQLGRKSVGIELNPEYVKLAEERLGV